MHSEDTWLPSLKPEKNLIQGGAEKRIQHQSFLEDLLTRFFFLSVQQFLIKNRPQVEYFIGGKAPI
jgi:hypothetical protein